jgi:hypothetical protein
MHVPYIEERCKTKNCPFAGTVSEPTPGMVVEDMAYIECLRDNEDAKKRFERTLNDEDALWLRQEVEFEHCLFEDKNISTRMAVIVQR